MKNRIKIERAIHDLTQQQLADAVGTSRQTINAIEKAKALKCRPPYKKQSPLLSQRASAYVLIPKGRTNWG